MVSVAFLLWGKWILFQMPFIIYNEVLTLAVILPTGLAYKALKVLSSADIVFLDTDHGLLVKSVSLAPLKSINMLSQTRLPIIILLVKA